MKNHGWVYPLPDGAKARCGGPGLCKDCSLAAAQKKSEMEEEEIDLYEHDKRADDLERMDSIRSLR